MIELSKKLFITLILILVGMASFAASPADGDNLLVWKKGAANAVVYSLDNLDKLTFDDTAMSVWTNKGKTDYAYSNIALVTFRDGVKPVAGIEVLTAAESNTRISYDHETQMVSVKSEKPLAGLLVYDLQGRVVAKQQANGTLLRLSLADLPQGVYIVKAVGASIGNSVKIIK